MSVGSNTVVGGGVVVHGRVHGAQDITIHGRVDGRVELAATLVVGTNAVLKADLQVKRVIVFGVVVGTIHAEEAVDLRAGARVVGDVYAPHLLMEDGALFKGNVATPDMAPRIPRPASQPPVTPRAPSAPPPSGGRPQPRVMPRQDVQPVELAPSLPPGESAVPPRGRTAPPPPPQAPAAEPRPAAPTRKRVGVVRGRGAAETAPPPARALSAPPSPEDAPPAPRPLPGRGSGARVQVKRR